MTAPPIDARYWVTLGMASVLGTNTGDYAAEILHVGHLSGLPWLAGLLGLVFVAQRVTRSASLLFYWAAIIVIRTAATNVGDVFGDYQVPFTHSLAPVLAVFVALAVLQARSSGRMIIVNPLYWATMLAVGVLGTVGGDAASFGLGLQPLGTAALFGALALAIILVFRRLGLWTVPLAYWAILGLVRTAGTGGGDMLSSGFGALVAAAGGGRSDVPSYVRGIGPATLLSGTIFAALLWKFYAAHRRADASERGT